MFGPKVIIRLATRKKI